MLLYLSPKLTLVAISIVPVLGVGAMLYGRRKKKLAQLLHRETTKASVQAAECIANIRTVKTFGCEQREADRFDRDMDATLPHAITSCSADGLSRICIESKSCEEDAKADEALQKCRALRDALLTRVLLVYGHGDNLRWLDFGGPGSCEDIPTPQPDFPVTV